MEALEEFQARRSWTEIEQASDASLSQLIRVAAECGLGKGDVLAGK
jgi:hypothetical protein